MKKLLILFFVYCIGIKGFSQYLILEEKVPANWETKVPATLSISSRHSKMGSQSVKWEWKSGTVLTIADPEGLKQAAQQDGGGMMLWIYNETPVDAPIRFEFCNYSAVSYRFNYQLNFKGWRACWVGFEEDMAWSKNSKEINCLKIHAPQQVAEGKLFFDRMIFPDKPVNHRRTPDAQLPYINSAMNDNHWGALWHCYSTYKYTLTRNQVSSQTITELKKIEERLVRQAAGNSFSLEAMEKAKGNFRALGIRRHENHITGPAFVSNDEYLAVNNDLNMARAGDILNGLAKGWHFYQDAACRQMFIDLADHLIDQGWAVGSGMGTNHHYGYQFRKFAPSFLLMKKILNEDSRLQEYTNVLLYWCAVPELREEPIPGTLQGIIDSWNTKVMPRLMAITMQNNLEQRDLDYRSFKRWMEASIDYSPGTMGGIKTDGTAFHHGGLYPAYSDGGFTGVGEYIAIMRDTEYMPDREARSNLKQALSCMISYCSHTDWGFGICGRHPLGGEISAGLIKTIGELAACGNPGKEEAIDRELAAAYLRLNPETGELSTMFKKAGITASLPPTGFFVYNYGALGIHRRDNWMVSLKGYNKYVWSSEIYTADNRFGRYQSYGTVQVLNAGDPVSSKANGFTENGWDWNRFPGATVIHLPLDLLESPYPGTLMEKSGETFAGALSLEGQNGIFGMKLRENSHPNFIPGFVARKSVFCFNDRLICLGTGISNSNTKYSTETVLFQTALQNKKQRITGSENFNMRNFPGKATLNEKTSNWLIDINGNGYYIPASQKVIVQKASQQSKHNKTKAETTGNFASAWIDHGKSPQNAEYEYAIWINSGNEQMEEVAKKMDSENEKVYEVLKKDNTAHIVRDRETGITGMVLFEAHSAGEICLVTDNSLPCLIMYRRESGERIRLSLVNPDLNLPDNSYTSNLPSQETEVSINLKGEWKLDTPSEKCTVDAYDQGTTRISFICRDGLPVEVTLDFLDGHSDSR